MISTSVRKEVKLNNIDDQVVRLFTMGEREIFIGVTFQNLENYGFFQQPFQHSWKCKGGDTVWIKIETLPTPEQQADFYCLQSVLRRQAYSAVAQAILKGGSANDGFMSIPCAYWVSTTPEEID